MSGKERNSDNRPYLPREFMWQLFNAPSLPTEAVALGCAIAFWMDRNGHGGMVTYFAQSGRVHRRVWTRRRFHKPWEA